MVDLIVIADPDGVSLTWDDVHTVEFSRAAFVALVDTLRMIADQPEYQGHFSLDPFDHPEPDETEGDR